VWQIILTDRSTEPAIALQRNLNRLADQRGQQAISPTELPPVAGKKKKKKN